MWKRLIYSNLFIFLLHIYYINYVSHANPFELQQKGEYISVVRVQQNLTNAAAAPHHQQQPQQKNIS